MPLRNKAAKSGSSLPPVWNPLDDEFEEILGGSWAVIRTADGWEIECQHSQTTLPLKSTEMGSAKIEGRKLARQFEQRYLPNAQAMAAADTATPTKETTL
jgi:hypothetical protein